MTTTADDAWRLLGELIESQKETARRFQETNRYIKQVSKDVSKLSNRLGEFVEWQVRLAVVRLFQERGIVVSEFYPNVSVQRAEGGLEIDLFVVNETEAVLIMPNFNYDGGSLMLCTEQKENGSYNSKLK